MQRDLLDVRNGKRVKKRVSRALDRKLPVGWETLRHTFTSVRLKGERGSFLSRSKRISPVPLQLGSSGWGAPRVFFFNFSFQFDRDKKAR
ncbi:unnamed protein product, partial [Iphiclides podalirius]